GGEAKDLPTQPPAGGAHDRWRPGPQPGLRNARSGTELDAQLAVGGVLPPVRTDERVAEVSGRGSHRSHEPRAEGDHDEDHDECSPSHERPMLGALDRSKRAEPMSDYVRGGVSRSGSRRSADRPAWIRGCGLRNPTIQQSGGVLSESRSRPKIQTPLWPG